MCAVRVYVCVCARVNCLDLSRRVASSRSSCRRAARKFTVQIFFCLPFWSHGETRRLRLVVVVFIWFVILVVFLF